MLRPCVLASPLDEHITLINAVPFRIATHGGSATALGNVLEDPESA
jgi:hypothetical protein